MTEKHVTYAHTKWPEGRRYAAPASEPIPVWAVDIQEDDGGPKNWLGFPNHPTDKFIDWWMDDPVKEMKKVRAAYDVIASLGVTGTDALNLLLEAAANAQRMEQSQQDAGPDL